MADLNYTVGIDAAGARRELAGLSTAFKTLVGGVALTQLVKFGDSITNLQNKFRSLGADTASVKKQFEAVAATAILTRSSLDGVGDLYFKIARSADDLGISLSEARSITESVSKAISASGISAQEAAGPLLQLGQALSSGRFQGDELRSILEGLPPVARALADSLGVPVGALKKLGSEGKITAEVFVAAMQKARGAIDKEFGSTISTVTAQFQNLKSVSALAFNEFESNTKVGQNLAATIEYIAASIFFASKSIDEWIGYLKTAARVVAVIATFTVIGRIFRGIAAAISWAASSLTGFISLLTQGLGAIAAATGIDTLAMKFNQMSTENEEAGSIVQRFREELDKMTKSLAETAGQSKTAGYNITQAIKDEIVSLAKIQRAYRANNAERLLAIKSQELMLNMTESERRIYEAAQEVQADMAKERLRLEERIVELKTKGDKESLAAAGAVQTALAKLTAEFDQQASTVERLTSQLVRAEQVKRLDTFTTEQQTQAAAELQKIMDDTAKLTMTETERKYYDIAAAAKASAVAEIAAEEARRGSKLDADEVKQYYAAAEAGAKKLLKAQQEQTRQARSWSTGWKKAMADYVDNATNAAKRAGEVFQKFTQGMEDMLVNFAKTGKFEWRSFVSDMLETLLRSQIQQVFSQMMGSMQGMGGIFGSIGELFGSAFGGGGGQPLGSSQNNALWVRSVNGGGIGGGNAVGSSLSNIFTGSKAPATTSGGGIGGGLSNIFTGVVNTVKNVGSSIWDTVSSIGSGISNLFGGFFANGGSLPAGKFGIVGERGPELITGPANITPITGGGGAVTYNINAVDAQSFTALLARDPGLIHALAQQGGKQFARR